MTCELNRRRFLSLTAGSLAATVFSSAGGVAAPARKRPNFLIIYSDDQGYGDLSCYGAKDIPTPHLDALAKQGVRFSHWYSNAPICAASRAALLTGRYPMRAGVPNNTPSGLNSPGLPPEEITLAEALKGLGYRTGLIGKWHLGSRSDSRPNAQGFDHYFGFLSGCVDYYSHIFYWNQNNGRVPYHDLWRNGEEQWRMAATRLICSHVRRSSFFGRGTEMTRFFLR